MEKKDRYHGDSSKVVEKVDVLLTVVHGSKRLTRWSSATALGARLRSNRKYTNQDRLRRATPKSDWLQRFIGHAKGIGDTDRHQHRSQHQPSHHIARKPGGLL